jgi:ABC-type sugar transport system substrate-binding protein
MHHSMYQVRIQQEVTMFAKRAATVGFVTTAIFATAACGTTGGSSAGGSANTGGPIKIGVSFDKMDDSFRVGEKKYLDQYAKEMGVQLVYQDAQSDAQRQSSQVQSFISQGVTGIIEIPWDTQAVASDISAAKSANVPLVVMDQQPADTSNVFFYVGGNPESDGKMAGEALVTLAKGQPLKVLELQGSLNNENGLKRSQGFVAAVSKASNITIVAKAPTDWKADKALAATQNALQGNPDLGAVYAPWTGALPAIYSALKGVNKLRKVGESGHVITISINGDEIGCKYVSDGSNDVDIATPVQEMAKQAIKAIADASKGTQPAQRVSLLPGLPYTPADLSSKKSQVWGCG